VINESVIRDPALAPEGRRKIDWVAQHAPVLNTIFRDRLSDGTLRGHKVAMTIHLEAKTAYLALLLAEAGADVTVAGSNPLSTQDDVCAALAERGVRVFATHDPTDEEFERYLHLTLETGPDLIVDDGAELVSRLVSDHPELVGNVIGASEETTTGVMKLKAMTNEGVLPFPVLAANDAKMKHLFDNRYGTGISSIAAILSNTNLFLSGKAVVVMGFGWVSRGLAKYADGMGARVIVCEPDPVKLLEAYSEGYQVMNSCRPPRRATSYHRHGQHKGARPRALRAHEGRRAAGQRRPLRPRVRPGRAAEDGGGGARGQEERDRVRARRRAAAARVGAGTARQHRGCGRSPCGDHGPNLRRAGARGAPPGKERREHGAGHPAHP
jgi:hypothetical protein